MAQPQSVILGVVTHRQDDVEALNKALREAGYASDCRWLRSASTLKDTLAEDHDLIVADDAGKAANVAETLSIVRDAGFGQPVVLLSESLDEAAISEAMKAGAADLVTLRQPERLRRTLAREIMLYRQRRTLSQYESSADQYRQQLTTLMSDVPDAIAHIQEGIIVHVNKAWIELFNGEDESAFLAMPLMDKFARKSRGVVKGALVAEARGKWNNEELQVTALDEREREIDVALHFESVEFDGEPAIRISIKPDTKPAEREQSLLKDAIHKDQVTFLYHREHFTKRLATRLQKPLDAGVRLLAWISPDNFSEVRNQVGILRSEDLIAELAQDLRDHLQANEFAGRFEGTALTVLLERGTEDDAEVWARDLCARIGERVFEIGKQTVRMTCSIGVCAHSGLIENIPQLIEYTEKAYRKARGIGRGQVFVKQADDEDTRMRLNNALWVKRLTAALKENRFRLLQQPIAALDGESGEMYDLLIRMIDEQGETVLPSEFLPVAERTNMMQALDRWVIGAAVALCRDRNPDTVFVRLSAQSILDQSFLGWLKSVLAHSGTRPAQFCFQMPEVTAAQYLTATVAIATAIRELGARFALEHFGVTQHSRQILDRIELDFVKIDGSVIQNLSVDDDAHQHAADLVKRARDRGMATIAERVEDANTMALLWQLGISFMQGHYVHEPEVILQDTA